MLFSTLVRRAALCLGVLALAMPGAMAQTGAVSLDADYTGSVGIHSIITWVVVDYMAAGENVYASSGLTRVDLFTEGFWDVWGGADNYYQTDPGWMTFSAPDGDRLFADFHGEGTTTLFEGAFTVNGGTGRYAGKAGSGTFRVQATGPMSASGSAPAMIAIRGTAATAAIPEPSSLSLLGLAGLAGIPLMSRRRFRPSASSESQR